MRDNALFSHQKKKKKKKKKKILFPVLSDFSLKTCFLTQYILAHTKIPACQDWFSEIWDQNEHFDIC